MLILRRLQLGLLAGVVLALALPVRAADVDQYLPEDTEVVLVVNAKQLLDSPLVKKHFLEQMRELVKTNAEVANILSSVGFDPFKDLTSVTGAMTMIGNDAKGLLITHGQFDKAKFEAKAEEVAKDKSDVLKIYKEGGRKVYEIKHDGPEKPHFVGVVDTTTIVASPDKQYVLDAFAKADGKKKVPVKKAIQDLIGKIDSKQSVWFTATANAFLKGDFSGDDKTKKNLEKMDSITAGVTVDKGVKVDLAIATKSAANAKELAEEIKEGLSQVKGLLALMADQDKNLAPLIDTVGKLQVNTEASTITLKSEVSEETIEKGLKKN
jgi:hypothetical protein